MTTPNTQFRDATPIPEDYVKGEIPTAEKHTNGVNIMRSLTMGVAPPRQVFQAGGAVAGVVGGGLAMRVLTFGRLTRSPGGQPTADNAHLDNHINAWYVDSEGERVELFVAKPYDLQRRIFEQPRNIRRPSATGIGFRTNVLLTYERLNPDRRRATESIGGIDTGEEVQVITPAYALQSDTILAIKVGSEVTGLAEIDWLDLNLAARAFMREPS